MEAALTGESLPVDKAPDCVLDPRTDLGDRRNMAYMGTIVAAGKASAVVVATGMRTELGRIAGMLQGNQREPTPLQRRLDELGKVLSVVCLGLVGLIFVLQLLRGGQLFPVLLSAVSLAVAAVPEGLPAVVTLALALGLQRMVRRNALIRKLPSVETLGSVTVICSDKTGTLTRNEMTVREIAAGGKKYAVTGVGYSPKGGLHHLPEDSAAGSAAEEAALTKMRLERADPDLQQLLTVAVRCNNARVTPVGDAGDTWQVVGDPTEGALLVAALKAGIEVDWDRKSLICELPFDSERKAMSVIVREPSGVTCMYTKGAPEVVLSKCVTERVADHVEALGDTRRQQIMSLNSGMAARSLRVLALAYRDSPEVEAGVFQESGLVFSGLVGMIDPPREEAKTAVEKCAQAGIRPVMITGDHPETALAIARELNIAGDGDRAVTGHQLDDMDDNELAANVEGIAVYARVSAEHKLRVVRAWKSHGAIVAMTGDGVNDAPAIKMADIGIAMGVSGTDVTKEVSAMVLTDDNFASIVNAVEEGRAIFDNIQKVLIYLLSCNCGEILLMLVASLLGWPVPLLPIQLLWINLVTDGLPALALSVEPPEPGIMRRKPRPPNESILTSRIGLSVLWQGFTVGLVALAAFAVIYVPHPEEEGRARTMAFCVLVYAELLRALAARSQQLTFGQLGLFTNPFLLGAVAISALLQMSLVTLPYARPVFETVSHFTWEWIVLVLLALVPISAIEMGKLLSNKRSNPILQQPRVSAK